jgi:ferredoxin--NADP+ reductase
MNTTQSPLRVAIIGSGPSGLYAAEALIKQTEVAVSVDVIERLPTPYGLVRYGVAPDHQKIKSVTALFQKTLEDPRVRFLGNVAFGSDLTHAELKRHYHAVIYTVGASSDRNLGIPGEALAGSLSATEFVAWYNGLPEAADRSMPLEGISGVAVVGVGNVAVDVTRVLAKSVDELRSTDIADHALEALETSGVKDIYMLGRRGAAQAKFTTKELRELGELLNADIVVKPEEIWLDAASEAATQGQPALQKNIEVLQGFAAKPQEGKPRRVHLRFLVSPVEVLGSERVEGLRIERNRLDQNQNAVGTGMFETLPVQMVLRSVGYKGLPLADVPFDGRKGIIPNEEGRVLEGNQVVGGEYVAGWIKRGPSGVIGTNKADAGETVKLLLADVVGLPDVAAPAPESIDGLLASKGVRVVTVKDWLALDRHEQEAGKAQGRPRVKVVSKEKMLERIEG